MKINADRLAYCLFIVSTLMLTFGYGVAVGVYEIFPYSQIREAKELFEEFDDEPSHYPRVDHEQEIAVRNLDGAYPGINLVTSVIADNQLSAKIMDMDGSTIHEWNIDWFEIWPEDDTSHILGKKLPQSRPGTEIHGAVVMKNGDLVFNFNELGLVRLSVAGKVVWRLPYQTHHSVFLHDDGKIWVSGLKVREKPMPEYPNYVPPFDEFTILEVSDQGEILQEISIFELLKENNLHGLLYLGNLAKNSTETQDDTLHLNDVECFPSSLTADYFDHNDIMISLRNINTVLVFHRDTHKVKYVCSGMFVRQHDPDFIDGQTISVFDNNNVGTYEMGTQSRIVTIDAPTNGVSIKFEGSESAPFYTDVMGKHQWLPNGNLLVTESMQGRAFEVNPPGEIVWEYINYLGPDQVGVVTEVTRLPVSYTEFYAQQESP